MKNTEEKVARLQSLLDEWSLAYLAGYIESLECDINRMKAAAGAPLLTSIFDDPTPSQP
jgi:hypothetical protein